MAEGKDTSTTLPNLLKGLKKSAREIEEAEGQKLAVESLPVSGGA